MLTVAGAVRALPMRDADARAWLLERGLILDVGDRKFVIWGRVLDELARAAPARAPARRRPSVRCDVTAGGGDCTEMGVKWPRPIVMGAVRAAPMKSRGRRDGRVYWRVRRTVGGRQVGLTIAEYTATETGWATRAEAESAIVAALANEQHEQGQAENERASQPRIHVDPRLTLGELLPAYVAFRQAMGGLSASTLNVYRGVARRLAASDGDVRVSAVTTASLEDYVLRRFAEGVGAGTVRLELAVLGPALKWAATSGRARFSKMPAIPSVPYTPERSSKPPSLRALRKAFQELEVSAPEVYVALRLQALLGARGGEIWALCWHDITDGSVRLSGKTGERDVPLSPAAQELLDGLPRLGSKVLGPLAEMSIGGFRSAIYRALYKLDWEDWGEERFRPHQLRSLFSNRLIRSGASLPVFQALTGHTAAVAAKHYWEARPDEKRAAVLAADIAGHLEVSITPLHGREGQKQEQE